MNDNDVVLAEQWIVSMYAEPETHPNLIWQRSGQIKVVLEGMVSVLDAELDGVRVDVSQ